MLHSRNAQNDNPNLTDSGVFTRRAICRGLIGLGIAALGATSLAGENVLAEESAHYQSTSAVNLRTGPGVRRRIILVIPKNSIVLSLGETKYGFRKVSYLGTTGWAHADYLTVTNGGSTDTPVPSGFAVTTSAVNFRHEPSTSAQVIRVLPAGTTVDTFDYFSDGFRMVGFGQQTGWVFQDFLGNAGVPAGYLTTETALNLRAEPSTGARVLAVIPQGKSVRATDEVANGFRRVNYLGTNGWAFDDYLS